MGGRCRKYLALAWSTAKNGSQHSIRRGLPVLCPSSNALGGNGEHTRGSIRLSKMMLQESHYPVCRAKSLKYEETLVGSRFFFSNVFCNVKYMSSVRSGLILNADSPRGGMNVIAREAQGKELTAVAEVLEGFLQERKGLQPKDARIISRNCPYYVLKLLRVAGERRGSECEQAVRVSQWLRRNEVDELEPFLESVGVEPSKIGELLPVLRFPLEGEHGFLRSVEILEGLGIARGALWDLLECNKQILTLTPAELKATVDFLERFGVKRDKHLVHLIQDAVFLMENLDTLHNLEKFGVQKLVIAEILKLHNLRGRQLQMPVGHFQARADFLLGAGLSRAAVTQRVKLFPKLLHTRLDNLRRKIRFLDSLGLERGKMAKVISRWPLFSGRNIEKKLRPKVHLLQSLGMDIESMTKILTRYPELGSVSLEDNLRQKVAFFEMNGLTGKRLVRLMTSHSRALTLSLNELNKKFDFLVQSGFDPGSVQMVRALGGCVTISVESMAQRFANLEALGFKSDEARRIVKQQPAILTLRETCIREKVLYLRDNMNRSIDDIVKCPCYLLYSLESRIKPRHRVISLLKAEGTLRDEAYSLNTIMVISEKRFTERFVTSLGAHLPQVGEAYYARKLRPPEPSAGRAVIEAGNVNTESDVHTFSK